MKEKNNKDPLQKIVKERDLEKNPHVSILQQMKGKLIGLGILIIIAGLLSIPDYNDAKREEEKILALRIDNDTSPIINIPDEYFKDNLRQRGFDLNGDGQYSQYEIDALLTHSTGLAVELNGYGKLESIEGIEAFSVMKQFGVSKSKVTDISPLMGIENLIYISFYNSNVEDVSPLLDRQDKLTTIGFENSKITDITPLLDLEREIETLNLRGNPLRGESEDSVFCGYVGSEFYVGRRDEETRRNMPYEAWGDRSLIDEEALASSEAINFKDPRLKQVLLDHKIDINKDGEISIYEANRLKGRLELMDYGITDITGMGYFDNIFYLDLSENSLENVDELFTLDNLRYLELDRNHIEKINVSDRNDKLMRLSLAFNEVSDLNNINIDSNIEELYLTGNPLKILNGINRFSELRILGSSDCKIATLKGIDENIKLEVLNLGYNALNLTNIEELTGLSNLEKLYLGGGENKIRDISGSLKLKRLKTLRVNENYLNSSETEGAVKKGQVLGYEIWVVE